MKDPFFKRYISGSGLDHVEPLFRQLKTDRPDLQLLMVILPGKTPVYGGFHLSPRNIRLSLPLFLPPPPLPSSHSSGGEESGRHSARSGHPVCPGEERTQTVRSDPVKPLSQD